MKFNLYEMIEILLTEAVNEEINIIKEALERENEKHLWIKTPIERQTHADYNHQLQRYFKANIQRTRELRVEVLGRIMAHRELEEAEKKKTFFKELMDFVNDPRHELERVTPN